MISGPENHELLKQIPKEKKVQVGLLDARNTKLESVDDLTATIERIVQEFGADRVYVSPSAGLEYLPREKARAKLQRLGEVVKKVGA
jgi:5-methyltetrahydropteroyltriglutamate--homocysteine methyltransferase